ncbi:hypothetical protein THASP1DRAFT_25158 [Thamnocephalis sphaerospora]|uniref:Uncharacterized protein n=1 Tax=Thamnocephalis sphaerospora TaxID=78915 RepID=A0A4P9XMN3_9FUNG|nr:hypothetical protein THASP1DRAFT_25158 [Thamnocephalis sphaerospora]|eukprot:RKP06540.1 hypothetical protein THASP1DRAFT_25158 [Thamnocephalis sphaerospora]
MIPRGKYLLVLAAVAADTPEAPLLDASSSEPSAASPKKGGIRRPPLIQHESVPIEDAAPTSPPNDDDTVEVQSAPTPSADDRATGSTGDVAILGADATASGSADNVAHPDLGILGDSICRGTNGDSGSKPDIGNNPASSYSASFYDQSTNSRGSASSSDTHCDSPASCANRSTSACSPVFDGTGSEPIFGFDQHDRKPIGNFDYSAA